MRLAPLLACLLIAGCLEGDPPGTGSPPGAGVTPTASTAVPGATPPGTTTPSPTMAPPPAAGPVTFETLGHGQMAGTGEEARRVFTDTPTFVAFWNSVREAGLGEEGEPAPDVDFNVTTVAAALADGQPNACWSLRITNATANEAGIVQVEVTTFSPPADMMCAQVVTYPWHVVALEGGHLDVVFGERTQPGPPPGAEDGA